MRDFAGNESAAASLSVPVDTRAPTATLTRVGTGVETGVFTVTATFDEVVQGFEQSDLSLKDGLVSAFTPAGGADASRVWSVGITPATDSAGILTIDLAAGAVMDAAGNPGRAAQLQRPSTPEHRTRPASLP